jgi:two-component system CheB/CheR fusion protein
VELCGYIDQAQVERRTLRVPDVQYTRAGAGTMSLQVHVNPLTGADASLLGVGLVFQDRTEARQLHTDLDIALRQAQTAHEELQSTNEELETTNEELQSTNDELQAINNELRQRTAELDTARGFLHDVLTGLRAGVAIVDASMHVRGWNRGAENLWGLREEEALGEHFLNLDVGLPTDQLRPAIRTVLSGESTGEDVNVEAVNRRGRAVKVTVTCTPLLDRTEGTTGVIVVMATDDG